MLLYLDTCCLNRPFDDQRQPRILLESAAMLHLLGQISAGTFQMACSDVLLFEVGRISDYSRRQSVQHFLGYAGPHQPLTTEIEARATVLAAQGFKQLDALHVASAEAIGADAFLSTDDRLLSRASTFATSLRISALNPVAFHLSHP